MYKKIKEQIIAVRDTGRTNMFDTKAVQRIAFDSGYYELVNYIEENKQGYCDFIVTGKFKEEH